MAHDQRPVHLLRLVPRRGIELSRASAATPPRTCTAPGKPLRAFRRSQQCPTARPSLSFPVIRQPRPTTSAVGYQSPRSPDIGSCAGNVSTQVGSDPDWRNPSRSPGGQVSKMPRMANFRPPGPRGLLKKASGKSHRAKAVSGKNF